MINDKEEAEDPLDKMDEFVYDGMDINTKKYDPLEDL